MANRAPRSSTRRFWPVALLAAVILVFATGNDGAGIAEATDPVTAELSFELKSGGTCDTTAKPTKCDVASAGSFTLAVSVNQLDDPPGSVGAQALVVHGGLIFNGAGVTAGHPCNEQFGPATDPQSFTIACATGLEPPLPTFSELGNIFDLEFNCTSTQTSQKVSLPTGIAGGTFVDDDDPSLGSPVHKLATQDQDVDIEGDTVVDATMVADTIIINCVPPVGGIAEVPDVEAARLETSDSSGRDVGFLVAIAAAAVAAVLAAGAWYAARRRSH